jgi:predicted O-linked N-acetylglucosamine transferase (SPINDLY family)
VGYVSGEFREQATGYLTADLYECHDRDAFELHGISTGIDDGSAMRKRIKAAFDVFSDVSRRSCSEADGVIPARDNGRRIRPIHGRFVHSFWHLSC